MRRLGTRQQSHPVAYRSRPHVQLCVSRPGVAGTVNVVLALIIGEQFPTTSVLLYALVLGAVSYGLSIYLDVRVRSLGAAREAGDLRRLPSSACCCALRLPERSASAIAAGALMAIGVASLLRERHEHTHIHEPLDHDHADVHYGANITSTNTTLAKACHRASHTHTHTTTTSSSDVDPHVSDIHHRHSHSTSARAMRVLTRLPEPLPRPHDRTPGRRS